MYGGLVCVEYTFFASGRKGVSRGGGGIARRTRQASGYRYNIAKGPQKITLKPFVAAGAANSNGTPANSSSLARVLFKPSSSVSFFFHQLMVLPLVLVLLVAFLVAVAAAGVGGVAVVCRCFVGSPVLCCHEAA